MKKSRNDSTQFDKDQQSHPNRFLHLNRKSQGLPRTIEGWQTSLLPPELSSWSWPNLFHQGVFGSSCVQKRETKKKTHHIKVLNLHELSHEAFREAGWHEAADWDKTTSMKELTHYYYRLDNMCLCASVLFPSTTTDTQNYHLGKWSGLQLTSIFISGWSAEFLFWFSRP